VLKISRKMKHQFTRLGLGGWSNLQEKKRKVNQERDTVNRRGKANNEGNQARYIVVSETRV